MNGPRHRLEDLPGQHGELAVGFALHALEPDQEAEFLAHLVDCRVCEEILAETTGTLGVLARAVPEVEPPPALRARLLAEIGEAVPGEEAADPVTDVIGFPPLRDVPVGAPALLGPAPVPDPAPPAIAPVVPLRRRVTTRIVAVAAAVAVIVVVGGLVATNQALRDQRDEQATAAVRADQVVGVLRDAGAPGARTATLATPAGTLVGVVVPGGAGEARVLTTGLPTNTSEQTYVLWGLAGATPVGLGAFDVSGSSPSARSVPSTMPADPFAGYAISLEPGRTVPAAPTDVVASGKVSR